MTTTEQQLESEIQEKVLAEAKLAEDRGIRVIRNENGDYSTEWLEPGNTWRSVHPTNLDAAMELFQKTVVYDEIATMAMEYGVRAS